MQAASTVVLINQGNVGKYQSFTVQQTLVLVPLIQNIVKVCIWQVYMMLSCFWEGTLAKRESPQMWYTTISRSYFRLSCMTFYKHKRENWIAWNYDIPCAKLIESNLIKNQLNYICQFFPFKLAKYFIRYATGLTLVCETW